ncbi:MAG TPA: hypothetical protein VFY66_17205, partial [Anaerolineales bacterium]|nr:hypothetical protein [Anaerolineales bacterium]
GKRLDGDTRVIMNVGKQIPLHGDGGHADTKVIYPTLSHYFGKYLTGLTRHIRLYFPVNTKICPECASDAPDENKE